MRWEVCEQFKTNENISCTPVKVHVASSLTMSDRRTIISPYDGYTIQCNKMCYFLWKYARQTKSNRSQKQSRHRRRVIWGMTKAHLDTRERPACMLNRGRLRSATKCAPPYLLTHWVHMPTSFLAASETRILRLKPTYVSLEFCASGKCCVCVCV